MGVLENEINTYNRRVLIRTLLNIVKLRSGVGIERACEES